MTRQWRRENIVPHTRFRPGKKLSTTPREYNADIFGFLSWKGVVFSRRSHLYVMRREFLSQIMSRFSHPAAAGSRQARHLTCRKTVSEKPDLPSRVDLEFAFIGWYNSRNEGSDCDILGNPRVKMTRKFASHQHVATSRQIVVTSR